MVREKFILAVIFLIALFLRTYKLDAVPISLSADEAAIGYNAYSIVQTGKDEYGASWPLLFQSFHDFKLPGYIYTAALSIKFLGLSDFAVRLPSALFGTLTVAAFYLLLRSTGFKEWQGLLGSFLFAISPWHLQFSRAAFEANGSLFFVVFGFGLLLYGRIKSGFLIAGLVSLTLSIYFYYSARVLVPLLLLVVVALYFEDFLKQKRSVLLGLVASLVILFPLIPKLAGDNTARISQVSIFNDTSTTNDYVIALARNPESLWANVVYNRRIGYIYRFLDNYLKNNSLEYLFISGDPYPRHHISGMGYLYIWEVPFFLIGVVYLFLHRSKNHILLLSWWLLGAIPASFTTGSSQGLRTLTTLPVFLTFTVVGISTVFHTIKKRQKQFLTFGLGVCMVVGFFYYLVYYYDYTPRHTPNFWGDGNRQLFTRLEKLKTQYDSVIVTGENFKPYIFALYYTKYDPAVYQQKGSENGFDKYIFTQASWEEKKYLPEGNIKAKTLFVRIPADINTKVPVLEKIQDSFGNDVFILQEGESTL